MKKRIMSIVVTLAMVVAMLPASAFAATNYFAVTKDGNTTEFETLVAAVGSVAKGETATIKLLDNYKGPGVKVGDKYPVNITFDLDGKTMDITNTVGSSGTETNGFQLLKGSTVKFMNGKITSSTAAILFQNYLDLTLENIEATLTTNRADSYVSSNNNGKTTIINSTLNAAPGGFALDSCKFGNYVGGDVFVDEKSNLVGNVEVTSGGKLELAGAITGDLSVYNKDSADVSEVTVNGGQVYGTLAVDTNGKATVTDGFLEGATKAGENSSLVLVSGAFMNVGEGVEFNNADHVILEDKNGLQYEVLGADYVKQAVKDASETSGFAKLIIVSISEGTKFDLPAGVVVENNSDTDVVVNDKTVAAGDSLTVPAKPVVNPQEKPAEGVVTPDTGDNLPMLPFVGFLLAAVTFAGAFVIRRKKTN